MKGPEKLYRDMEVLSNLSHYSLDQKLDLLTLRSSPGFQFSSVVKLNTSRIL